MGRSSGTRSEAEVGAVVRMLFACASTMEHLAAVAHLVGVKPRRPTSVPSSPVPSTPAPARSRKALRSLDETSLEQVVGGAWTDGGITANDSWEAPVV